MTVDDIRKIINSILVENGENQVGDFVFGKFEDIPNKRGVFQIKSGPFADEDILFACAKMLHKSKYFEKYRFSNEAKKIYFGSHYRSVKDVELL